MPAFPWRQQDMKRKDTAKTEWRSVVGYEGLYEVSSTGLVRSLDRYVPNKYGTKSLRRGQKLAQIRLNKYPAVGLCREGKQRLIKIHVLVGEAFIGPRPSGFVMRHLDGNCLNNRVENLQWGTQQENADDLCRHGRQVRGEQVPTAKLTPAKVRRIRRLLQTKTAQAVADAFGMSNQQISNIRLGKHWRHLT